MSSKKQPKMDVNALITSWVGPLTNSTNAANSKAGDASSKALLASRLLPSKAGLGYSSSNNNNNATNSNSAKVVANIGIVGGSDGGLGYSTALEESLIRSNKRKLKEEQQLEQSKSNKSSNNNNSSNNNSRLLSGHIDKDIDDDDDEFAGKASVINKKSRIEYIKQKIPFKATATEQKQNEPKLSNGNGNGNIDSSKKNNKNSNSDNNKGSNNSNSNCNSNGSSNGSSSSNNENEQSHSEPQSFATKNSKWFEESTLKTRKKTRSKQKNIRKDTRAMDAKPSHLRPGSKDYAGRPITKETKAQLFAQTKSSSKIVFDN